MSRTCVVRQETITNVGTGGAAASFSINPRSAAMVGGKAPGGVPHLRQVCCGFHTAVDGSTPVSYINTLTVTQVDTNTLYDVTLDTENRTGGTSSADYVFDCDIPIAEGESITVAVGKDTVTAAVYAVVKTKWEFVQ